MTTIAEFQQLIEQIYYQKDSQRGIEGTFRWFIEEVGELARGLRRRDAQKLNDEFADVLAWLSTLASLSNVDLEVASQKYARGCPKCHNKPCQCPERSP